MPDQFCRGKLDCFIWYNAQADRFKANVNILLNEIFIVSNNYLIQFMK